MKNTMWIVSFILTLGLGGSAYAQGDHMHEGHKMTQEKGHHMMAQGSKDVTFTGHLIGLSCFVKHGATGESHKKCAQMCAEKGLPVGLKVEGQGIFVVTGEGHTPLTEAYQPLLKYLEGKVTVKGKAFEKEGVRMIVIEKIKSA